MKPSIQGNLDPLFYELVKSIDPRVCIDLFLWAHPDQSQASLARDVFEITSASFSKALNKNVDYLRPDWCDKICEMIRETDLTAFEAKFKRILSVKQHLAASDAKDDSNRVSDDLLELALTNYRGSTRALLFELKEYRQSGMKPSGKRTEVEAERSPRKDEEIMLKSEESRQIHQLHYDPDADRYVLGGRELHCGDTFEVLIIDSVKGEQRWAAVRIEMNSNNKWYLVGAQDYQIDGLFAR